MKKAITLHIPEPCHEDWNKMTPTEKGKFCSVCTKEVFDFTKASDEELYKKVQSGSKLCGRLRVDQLNRPIQLERKNGTSLAPYAASLLLPLSLMANNPKLENSNSDNYVSLGIGSRTTNTTKAILKVSGRVTDSNGLPVKNAVLRVVGWGEPVSTNDEGLFAFKCPSGSKIELLYQDEIKKVHVMQSHDEHLDFVIEIPVTITAPPVKFESTILGNMACVSVVDVKESETAIEEITMGDVIEIEESLQVKSDTIQRVKGIVLDESNLSLPGANVIIKGTNKGTQTDFDGNFELEAEKGDILVFSYVGYLTKELKFENSDDFINIHMEMDEAVLGGIVMVGFVVSYTPSDYVSDPYAPTYNEGGKEIEERLEYNDKVNAWKQVKLAREKAARKLKRFIRGKK